MNIEILRSFVTVAETLNFRRASELLFISQPALSHQIMELERNIGTSLLKRTTRSTSLTPAGEACLAYAKTILRDWDAMRAAAACADDEMHGTLRVGTYAANTIYYISSAFEQFKHNYPHVQLEGITGSVEELRAQLQSGELDLLAIMLPCIADMPDIEYAVLAEETPSVMVSLSHPLASRERIRLEELENEPLVCHSTKKSRHMYNAIMELCAGAGFAPNILTTQDNDNMLTLRIVMGEAIGIYPTDGSVAMPPIPYEAPPGCARIPLECDNRPFSRVIAWQRDNGNLCRKLFLDCLQM